MRPRTYNSLLVLSGISLGALSQSGADGKGADVADYVALFFFTLGLIELSWWIITSSMRRPQMTKAKD